MFRTQEFPLHTLGGVQPSIERVVWISDASQVQLQVSLILEDVPHNRLLWCVNDDFLFGHVHPPFFVVSTGFPFFTYITISIRKSKAFTPKINKSCAILSIFLEFYSQNK
jgi:hypothetical protein